MNNNLLNLKNILLISSLSLLFSFVFFNDQVAVRGGLVISGEVNYENNISPLKYYFLNSWTLLTQISAILLKFGLDSDKVSFFLIFLLNLILFFTCILIFNKFLKNSTLSIFLTCLLIFFQKNLGDTDYPSLIFTIHTFGAYAQALTGLIIASLLYKNLKITIFFSFLLLSIHPIVGLWILLIILFFSIILKEIKSLKHFAKIIFPGLIILFISLIFYFNFSIEKTPYDPTLFDTYMELWDGHRSLSNEIYYEYIIKSFLFLSILIFLSNNKENKLFIFVVSFIVFSSIIIYLSFKFFNLSNFGILSTIIPGRFMITYTFVAWPLVLALIYSKLKDKKYINHIFYFIVCVYSIMHYKNFIQIKDVFEKPQNNNYIFTKLKNLKNTGNIISSENATFNILYLSKKPLLLSKGIDFLPYHPYLINSVQEILVEVYGYDFNYPPIKNYPYLNDGFIKQQFENRSLSEWVGIKEKFKSNIVVTPKSWDLNLELIFFDKKFKVYRII